MEALKEYALGSLGLYTLTTEAVFVPVNNKCNYDKDEEIWEAFKAGDKRAYELMFRDNFAILLSYGMRFNPNEEDIKDYIHQLFARLWESRKRLGKNDSIKSYLLASLRRIILRGSKRKLKFLDLNSISPAFHLNLSVENRFLKNEKEKDQIRFLSRLVEGLPKRQKEAIYLRYYGDHDIKEIAEIMGISGRVVYKLVYKGLKNLSSQINHIKNTVDLL